MSRAFSGHIPDSIIQDLKYGDHFFVQTLDSWLSWLVMYLTKSEISHVAIYAGNRMIQHATTAGVHTEPLEKLLRKDTLVIPCSLRLTSDQQEKMRETLSRLEGNPYDWRGVLQKAVRIISGREPLYFRISFIFDFAFLLLLLDLPFLFYTGTPVFSLLLPIYALWVSVNLVIGKLRPLPITPRTTKPIEIFTQAWSLQADFYMRPLPGK